MIDGIKGLLRGIRICWIKFMATSCGFWWTGLPQQALTIIGQIQNITFNLKSHPNQINFSVCIFAIIEKYWYNNSAVCWQTLNTSQKSFLSLQIFKNRNIAYRNYKLLFAIRHLYGGVLFLILKFIKYNNKCNNKSM